MAASNFKTSCIVLSLCVVRTESVVGQGLSLLCTSVIKEILCQVVFMVHGQIAIKIVLSFGLICPFSRLASFVN